MQLLSVIIPMYNEEEVIAESYRRLHAAVEPIDMGYELIFINDGSRDKTYSIMSEIQKQDPHVKLISFSKNFGHQLAVTAGLDYASGDAIVIIDADLQDPPELIPEMIRMWREGAEVVYGKRSSRKGETFFKKFTAFAFYRTLRSLAGYDIPADTGDFRLIDRKVADVMRNMREHNRFLRGMVPWTGFKQVPLEYARDERWAGTTKYTMKKMLNLALNGILAFSDKPFTLMGGLGIGMMGIAGIWLVVLLVLLCVGMPAPIQAVCAFCLLLTGILVLCMSILGLYLTRVYDEVKGRPLYIVSEAVGFDTAPESSKA